MGKDNNLWSSIASKKKFNVELYGSLEGGSGGERPGSNNIECNISTSASAGIMLAVFPCLLPHLSFSPALSPPRAGEGASASHKEPFPICVPLCPYSSICRRHAPARARQPPTLGLPPSLSFISHLPPPRAGEGASASHTYS